MALVAFFLFPKLFGKAMLTNGMMSVGSNFGVSRFSIYFHFDFASSILYEQFKEVASATCQIWVPYGTPKQQYHLCLGSFTYCRNGNIIQLW
jgi:hypothetical protein